MTIRLYYDDSYLREFSASVVERRDEQGRLAVVLDRTAFYPTSGGQPHDTGTLGTARVLEVGEEPSGAIVHILDAAVPTGPVSGHIDWERRFDHMQQHTGQHILSQAFEKVLRAPTVSFHLGQDVSTIDVGTADPATERIQEVQELASSIVFENRPVNVLTVDQSQLNSVGLRKDSQRTGVIRIIDIEGFDRSACGGTHVRHTGEIGMIFILGCERYKGGTRVEFVCGGRVLKTFRNEHRLLTELGRKHTASFQDLPVLVDKALQERLMLQRENARLQEQVIEMEAKDLIAVADKSSGKTIMRRTYAGRTLESIKLLAQKAVAEPAAIAILALQDSAQVVVACSPEIPIDCNAAIKSTAARLGGRGGGRRNLAQAGAIPAEKFDEWIRALESCFLLPGNR